MSKSSGLAPWLWVIVGLAAYLLPWVANPGVGLTLGGYDLAEWSSLNPAVRATGLTTSLLLRLPPVLFFLAIALWVGHHRFKLRWWAALIIIGLGAVASLPPLEFFTIFRDDPNYQQQFQMAILTLIGGMIALSGLLNRVRWYLVILIGFAGVIVSVSGMTQGQRLMTDLSLPTVLGIGGFATTAAFGLLVVVGLNSIIRTRA